MPKPDKDGRNRGQAMILRKVLHRYSGRYSIKELLECGHWALNPSEKPAKSRRCWECEAESRADRPKGKE